MVVTFNSSKLIISYTYLIILIQIWIWFSYTLDDKIVKYGKNSKVHVLCFDIPHGVETIIIITIC